MKKAIKSAIISPHQQTFYRYTMGQSGFIFYFYLSRSAYQKIYPLRQKRRLKSFLLGGGN